MGKENQLILILQHHNILSRTPLSNTPHRQLEAEAQAGSTTQAVAGTANKQLTVVREARVSHGHVLEILPVLENSSTQHNN